MKNLDLTLDSYVENKNVEHIAVRVGKGDRILYDTFRGGVDEHTVFDMASITKSMSTTSLALIALDKGLLSLDDTVNKFYETEKSFTIKNLLTHTSGVGNKSLNKEGYTYENIAEKILGYPLDYPTGTKVVYSCSGFILLGKILEKVFGDRLDRCFDKFVATPLRLSESTFLPKDKERIINANLWESNRGKVNDYNAQYLGGVAGNAGLFSTLTDVTKYINFLLNSGRPLISKELFDLAVQNHTPNMGNSRGLGFVYVDEQYKQSGGLLSAGTIGHCGHTGQSFFVDCRTGFYVIILSDAEISVVKKFGGEKYSEVMDMRRVIHSAIKSDLNEM